MQGIDSSEHDYSPVFLNGELYLLQFRVQLWCYTSDNNTSDYLTTSDLLRKINNFFISPTRSGELEAARATNVNLYIAQKIKSQKKKKAPPNQKRVGLLIITNFRLCFIVFEEHDKNDKNNSNKVNFMCDKIPDVISQLRNVVSSFLIYSCFAF